MGWKNGVFLSAWSLLNLTFDTEQQGHEGSGDEKQPVRPLNEIYAK